VLVYAGNAPLIPAYLLSLFIQVQTAVERIPATAEKAERACGYRRSRALKVQNPKGPKQDD